MPLKLFGGSSNTKEAQEARDKEQMRVWTRSMKSEMRGMERQIAKVKREEEKVRRECKQLAAKNEINAVKTLVKELVRSRKAVERLYMAKTHMNSVCMELTAMTAQMKIAETMGMSSHIMQQMGKLVSVKEVQQEMAVMQREMMKAGLIQETINEAMDEALDDDVEDDAEKETQAILEELALTNLAGLRATATGAVGGKAAATVAQDPETKKKDEELMARLNAL